MSRFVACISDCEETSFSDLTYEFIQQKGELPSDEQLYHIIKQSHSLDDAFHKINQLFAAKTKAALLNAVSVHYRHNIAEKLTVQFQQSTESPVDDNCFFQYGSYVIEEPDTEHLLNFYAYLENIEAAFFSSKLNIKNILILEISKQVSDSVLDILEEGIYLPVVDSSCGESETIIVELAFLRDMAKTNEDTRQRLDGLYKALAESNKDFPFAIQKYEPHLLALEVSTE